MIDYSKYKMNLREMLIFFSANTGVMLFMLKLFYNTPQGFDSFLISALICSPFSYFALRFEAAYLCQKRMRSLTVQFSQALSSINAALSAGYSFENAVREACSDMAGLYGEKSYIYIEFVHILRRLSINSSIEDAFSDFAARTADENILNFSSVLYIAKRSSGNISKIINDATLKIKDRLELERHLHTLISARSFEKNIMIAMPPAIIIYVRLAAYDFLMPVYVTLLGRLVMTAGLILYIFAIYVSQKILKIQ